MDIMTRRCKYYIQSCTHYTMEVEVAVDGDDGAQRTSMNGQGCTSMRQQGKQKTEAGGLRRQPFFLSRPKSTAYSVLGVQEPHFTFSAIIIARDADAA